VKDEDKAGTDLSRFTWKTAIKHGLLIT